MRAISVHNLRFGQRNLHLPGRTVNHKIKKSFALIASGRASEFVDEWTTEQLRWQFWKSIYRCTKRKPFLCVRAHRSSSVVSVQYVCNGMPNAFVWFDVTAKQVENKQFYWLTAHFGWQSVVSVVLNASVGACQRKLIKSKRMYQTNWTRKLPRWARTK